MRGLLILGVLGLALVCSGCSAQTGPTNGSLAAEPAMTERSDTPSSRVGFRGPESLPAAALHTLVLTAEQRATVEDVLIRAAKNAPVHPEKARIGLLAATVRSGEPPMATTDVIATPTASQLGELATALATLHSTLTTAQRRELVATLKKELTAMPAPVTTDETLRVPMHLRPLLADLELSAEQKMLLASSFAGREEADAKEAVTMRARLDAVREARLAKLAAFASEAFDAHAFVAPIASAAPSGPDPVARDLAVAAKILTAAQRENVAQRLESGAL